MSYAGFSKSIAGVGSWSAASLPTEEPAVHGALEPTDTPSMIMASEEEPTKDNDDTEIDYIPAKHLSDPDYTPANHSCPDPSSSFIHQTTHQLDLSFLAQITSRARTRRIFLPRWRSHHPSPLLHIAFRAHTTSTRTAHHSDRIGLMDSELILLRMNLRQVAERV
ncbi:unnamed protein product [Lactuca virosa]|uniref:Uncharacterized protein n=1 Tax=Lactuca virosa TaxID=75947 RepID=A0AAU9MNQ0_9ASTR|nr:unnamed protein product [Lactuca virosa]